MAKLALAVSVVLSFFALSSARYVPHGLPDTETQTLSLLGGEGQKPVAIRLPSEKPSSFDPHELVPLAEVPIDVPKASASGDGGGGAIRPRMFQIEIRIIPVDRRFANVHNCRHLRLGPPHRVGTVLSEERAAWMYGGEHRPLLPARAERMGADVAGMGESSVKATETRSELLHFARLTPAEGR